MDFFRTVNNASDGLLPLLPFAPKRRNVLETKQTEGIAIGIDFGTSYSRVAFVNDTGELVIIPDERGVTQMPSITAFNDRGCLIGEAVNWQMANNPADLKRLIGRKIQDPILQNDIKR